MATIGQTQYYQVNTNNTPQYVAMPFAGNVPNGYNPISSDQYIQGLQGKISTANDFLTNYFV